MTRRITFKEINFVVGIFLKTEPDIDFLKTKPDIEDWNNVKSYFSTHKNINSETKRAIELYQMADSKSRYKIEDLISFYDKKP